MRNSIFNVVGGEDGYGCGCIVVWFGKDEGVFIFFSFFLCSKRFFDSIKGVGIVRSLRRVEKM